MIKLLLIFTLVIDNSLAADFHGKVTKNVTGKEYNGFFETRAEAEAWVVDNESNLSWGPKSSYTYTIDDITAEKDIERAAIQARKDDIVQIKGLLSNFKAPDSPAARDAWEVKVTRMLKRLIKETRE